MERIEIDSLKDLHIAAELIAALSGHKGTVAFYGEMGAGKTTLIREICTLLGVADNVASPTFSIVNHYVTPGYDSVYHFDFYRIDRPEEAFDLGYEEYFYGDGLCLVEWPEKIEHLLPGDTLKVRIEVADESRRIITVG